MPIKMLLSSTVAVRNQQIQRRFVRTWYYRTDAVGLCGEYRLAHGHKRCFARKRRGRVLLFFFFLLRLPLS